MNVPNFSLLASYRKPGLCQMCRKPCNMRCAAHVFGRGAGRVDAPINLIQLGMDALRDCSCHHNSHARGKPSREDFLEVVSAREGVPVALIIDTIHAVRACPRYSTFAKSSVWLREHFHRDAAEAAIAIIEGVYKL